MTERKEHWDKIYSDKSPLEVSWYQDDPALSWRLIRDAGLPRSAAIIDVGGGASKLVDRLCDEGCTDISVLDLSANALAHARQRLALKKCEVNWYVEDVTRFEPPRRFSLWHDRAVFHFLTDKADRVRYVAVLKRALNPGGHLIMMTFAIGGPLKCSGLDIVQYDADKLMGELGTGFELLEAGGEVHKTPAGGEQKFAYFHLLRTTEAIS